MMVEGVRLEKTNSEGRWEGEGVGRLVGVDWGLEDEEEEEWLSGG